MSTQSTRCDSAELADLEKWLASKGIDLVDKAVPALQPGEYVKVPDTPDHDSRSSAAVWTVTWYPKGVGPS